MWTTAHIRRHIRKIGEAIFTTRELLAYGTRAAVDQALCRMVDTGDIVRLARGVFITSGAKRLPSALEVARAKAAAFGKRLCMHGLDAAHALRLVARGNSSPTYATTGCSSSFRFGDTVIRMHGVSPRQTGPADSAVGIVVRALWYLGRGSTDAQLAAQATNDLKRTERHELLTSSGVAPEWMMSLLRRGSA